MVIQYSYPFNVRKKLKGERIMKSLKGTQTEKNILTAFAGESQARNRYDFFSSKAKNDGFRLVQEVFAETASQEKEHAKRLFKFLEGGEVEIVGAFPAGIIGSTEVNLVASAAGENHEHTIMYPEFAATADKEGFSEIAAVMRNIAIAEAFHEKCFLSLAKQIKEATMFKQPQPVMWHCLNCGWLHEGSTAPELCGACNHPRAHFEVLYHTYG